MPDNRDKISAAAELIRKALRPAAFTGAGISVESGIPPFRGINGLWSKYDPKFIDIDFFYADPKSSWAEIKKIFYDFMGKAVPNPAHTALAEMERKGRLEGIITQNIDNLHQDAGSCVVHEFHGTVKNLVCQKCGKIYPATKELLDPELPVCPSCAALLKPDFVFYGEPINPEVFVRSMALAQTCDLMIVIGTSGEVMPACDIPFQVKRNGGKIIEINTLPSTYTDTVSDIYIEARAGEVMPLIEAAVFKGK